MKDFLDDSFASQFGVILFATIIGGASSTLLTLNTMATAKENQINVIRDYM